MSALRSIVSMHDVSFKYGRHTVLDRVSFSIPPGITGLLGPNGAGKTTLLSVISTLRMPAEGEVVILGEEVSDVQARHRIRQRIGVLPQSFNLVGWLKVIDTVSYAAWTHGLAQADCENAARTALLNVGIKEELFSKRVRALSGGQRQRVGIACAMAHRPDLILLDEPTSGLDPTGRMEFRRLLLEVAKSASVIMSTHLIEDIHHTAQYLVVIGGMGVAYSGSVSGFASEGRENLAAGSPLEIAYEQLLGNL
ncbi:hypothetical protein BSZ39_08185 [Bowdeniella nasicola]|uniref:ABC transporter domain-containing protein n=1 Tax=Bowdeniella nasicola TaxID=208480 RepID=A0A1Q5Q1K0_9ACTO|nr:ABC transporter ATP-binding protein [Bowdeniella nasicola]OKL53697.1 hypothetical protein BSZ39_08185 [Bowdeniella nasicola]